MPENALSLKYYNNKLVMCNHDNRIIQMEKRIGQKEGLRMKKRDNGSLCTPLIREFQNNISEYTLVIALVKSDKNGEEINVGVNV